MTAQPPEGAQDRGEAADLEYDLAHEAASQPFPPASSRRGPDPCVVATETSDYDGDYGYDLAHDIPRSATEGRDARRP